MARPRSSSKAPTQRGGAGTGKRKHGGPSHHGGGAGGRPAKQSRREGKSKPVDRDVFEAEDSDPDEVKHSERFDKVDNYEYELPSDFEDEEIDEELAFTEEDKKKFGAWFEKEVSADEGDDGDDIGDDDGDDWDNDGEDVDLDDDGDDDDKHEHVAEDEDGTDDDLFLDDDDDEDEGMDVLEDEDGEGEDGDERHRAMLRDVLGAAATGDGGEARRRTRRGPNAAVVSEAYPESEYNLNPGAASAGGSAAGMLSVADLLQGLTGDERRKLGAARRLLEKVAGAGKVGAADGGKAAGRGKAAAGGIRPVAVPLPSVVAERQERKAGYEAAAEEVTKWQSIVKANREAPTLRLVSGRAEVPRVSTTAALVAQHVPSADNALEAEVAALLEAAGADSTKAIEEAEEQLALKALSLEEAKERRERLAKMRSLLFYHELKARRLKSIKSKEYHRHLSRAAKRKATKLAAAAAEAGGEADVDAERAAAIEAEFQRAKERLTQRHRNSSRWARRALKRGQLQVDAGTKAALAEQLQLGQQLKRKIEGRKGSDSDGSGDSDASTSASDGEGGEGGRPSGGRARSAALELLAGGGPLDLDGENAPKKGLLALPFMKRAMERRKLAAQHEAEQLLRELDEQQQLQQEDDDQGGRSDGDKGEADGGGAGGLLAALVGYGVPGKATDAVATVNGSGRRKFGGGGAAAAAAAAAASAAGDDVDGGSDVDSDDAEDAEAKAERLGRRTKTAAAAAAANAKQAAGRGKKARKGGKDVAPLAAPPTAADEADLDAAIAAGAAGRGLLVASSDLGVDLAVDGGDAAANAERRDSGRRASTRAAGAAAASKGKGNILKDVADQQASMAAGGGRAALFEGAAAAGKATGAGGAPAAAAAPKFVPAKKFGGVRPGYAFKKGPQGVGYYKDSKAAVAVAAAPGPDAAGSGKGKGKKGQQGQQQDPELVKESGVKVAGKPAQPLKQQPLQKGLGEQAQQQEAAAAAATGAAEGVDDGDEDAPMMQPAGTSDQRDLIRQAFAGDDVEAEFAAEKAAAVAEELPNVEEPSALPGWGAWAGQQRNPRWMQAAKDKAAKIRADAAAGRKDANLKYVVISEKWDKKAIKYTAPTAPFPFTSQEAYERSLRQPLGREFNPDTAFRDLTRPAVLKQAGVAIAPLRFSESVAKQLGKKGRKAEEEREARRVVTVAGGMLRPGSVKKQKQ